MVNNSIITNKAQTFLKSQAARNLIFKRNKPNSINNSNNTNIL